MQPYFIDISLARYLQYDNNDVDNDTYAEFSYQTDKWNGSVAYTIGFMM